jgi:ADP-dependent glucokinase
MGTSPQPPKLFEVLNEDKDISHLLAYSMESCLAVERFFTDLDRFKEIVKIASKDSLKHEFYIGGNAALMAQKLTQLTPDTTSIFLGGPVGGKLRELLSPRINTGSQSSSDEVHMILEYSTKEEWGRVTAPCSNRIVFSNDVANSEMTAVDDFFGHIQSNKPDLVILAGIQLLERYSRSFWQKKLQLVVDHLKGISPLLPLHLELASIGNIELLEDILPTLLPYTPSLGLNEQELKSTMTASGGPTELLSRMYPPQVGVVADSLYWLLSKYGNMDVRTPNSVLSRIHFHSLKFHVLAHFTSTWGNGQTAVVKGTEIAGKQACDDEVIIPSKMSLKIPDSFVLSFQDEELRNTPHVFDPNSPQLSWKRGRVEFHFSPVLVCKNPLKTVGLGDAISSTGLLYSQYYGPAFNGDV